MPGKGWPKRFNDTGKQFGSGGKAPKQKKGK